jgi:hypothetical protein
MATTTFNNLTVEQERENKLASYFKAFLPLLFIARADKTTTTYHHSSFSPLSHSHKYYSGPFLLLPQAHPPRERTGRALLEAWQRLFSPFSLSLAPQTKTKTRPTNTRQTKETWKKDDKI